MQAIIDIPEEIMEYIKTNGCLSVIYSDEIAKAIIDGTVLPKGHGRLVILSENAIEKELMPLSFSCQKWISEVGLSNATVMTIGADKEAENNETTSG